MYAHFKYSLNPGNNSQQTNCNLCCAMLLGLLCVNIHCMLLFMSCKSREKL